MTAVALGGPPPIVRLILTLQFQVAATSLTVLDLAALRALFESRFPVFHQVNRAGAMPIYPAQAVEHPFGMPRLSMSVEDLSMSLLVQDDRVSLAWNRLASLEEDPSYPGFSKMLEYAQGLFKEVIGFVNANASEAVMASVGEVSYTDAFVVAKGGRITKNLGDVFTCVNSIPDFRFGQLSLTYWKVMETRGGDPIDGSSETQISGLTATAAGEAIVNLQTTIRFSLAGADKGEVERLFIGAHDAAHGIFSKLVKPGAAAILTAS